MPHSWWVCWGCRWAWLRGVVSECHFRACTMPGQSYAPGIARLEIEGAHINLGTACFVWIYPRNHTEDERLAFELLHGQQAYLYLQKRHRVGLSQVYSTEGEVKIKSEKIFRAL